MGPGEMKTMMFRRLYWVTEQVQRGGTSQVTGVYTSIPDLIHRGLRWIGDHKGCEFRLTLVKLDCEREPLGSWQSPDFSDLGPSLDQFIETDEFSADQCAALQHELQRFSTVHA